MSVMTNGGTVIFNDPVTEDGTTSISLTMLGQLDTACIVALDKKGGTHACGMYVHGFASADASRKFPAHQLYKGEVSLPLSAIDQFLFQTRETKKITFKNIVVQPGVEPKPDGEPMDQSSAVETEEAAGSPESPTPPDSMPDDSPPAVEKAEAQACQFEDLRTMRMYASAVGIYYIDAGSWPRNLEALIEHKGKKFISELKLMENHATGKMEKPLYHGGPNLQVEASKCSILAAPSPDREGERMVGFLDGSVKVIDDQEYQKQLEQQQKPPMERAVDTFLESCARKGITDNKQLFDELGMAEFIKQYGNEQSAMREHHDQLPEVMQFAIDKGTGDPSPAFVEYLRGVHGDGDRPLRCEYPKESKSRLDAALAAELSPCHADDLEHLAPHRAAARRGPEVGFPSPAHLGLRRAGGDHSHASDQRGCQKLASPVYEG